MNVKRKYRRKVSKNQRHCEVVTCCGKTFPKGFLSKHRAGLLHRSTRVLALLRKDCLSHAEIAARVGVSRERVRQIGEHFGLASGNERSIICTLRRRRLKAFQHPAIVRFKKACEKNGLSIDLMPLNTANDYYVTAVLVGPVTVKLKRAHRNTSNHYCSLAPRGLMQTDFVAYQLPDDRWLLLPWDAAPKNHTQFAIEPDLNGRGMTSGRRHDYPRFIEAWDGLRKHSQDKAA